MGPNCLIVAPVTVLYAYRNWFVLTKVDFCNDVVLIVIIYKTFIKPLLLLSSYINWWIAL